MCWTAEAAENARSDPDCERKTERPSDRGSKAKPVPRLRNGHRTHNFA
jgi:hypothetical protein